MVHIFEIFIINSASFASYKRGKTSLGVVFSFPLNLTVKASTCKFVFFTNVDFAWITWSKIRSKHF